MKEITFVMMTCGELSENKCMSSIKHIRKDIVFKVVRNVYPQIKALNAMIGKVDTEFFIPLDSDIVLRKCAWGRITRAIDQHRDDPNWHSILFPLWDTLTSKKILALKIIRTSVAKKHMFAESATPDVEHFQRLTNAGYTCIDQYISTDPIGNHIVKGKHFCYHKYRDVYQTFKSHGIEWDSGAFLGGRSLPQRAKCHYQYFLRKWIETNKEDYLWCISGMMDGILSLTKNKSKDLSSDLTLSREDGVRLFVDWYMKNGEEFQSGNLIF